MPRKLSELEFVDLYVCLEGGEAPHCHKPVTGHGEAVDTSVPPEFNDDIARLTAFLQEKFTKDEMGLTFDGVRLRAAKVRTAGGLTWASLRRINAAPPKLSDLGFTANLVPHLQNLAKRDGLIIVCGSTGQGKTTSSCSLLADFLDRHGGVAFTIEDPVEYVLEGKHGKNGYCYQVEVHEDEEWAEMLKRGLRWHPRYLFVGEIRTPDAANQLLRAATTGHLALTSIHAGTIEEAFEGLLQLSEQSVGDRASTLLAAGITAIVHQTLTPHGLQAQFYITEPFNPASPFRGCIREKKIGQTRTLIDQQNALLVQGGRLFRDGSA